MTTDRQLDRLLVDYLAVESRVQEQLPFILEAITSQGLLRLTQQDDNEPTRRKWIARLNTLLQSKNARTRWAALSLIKLTCEESTDWAVAAALSWHNQLLTLVGRPEPLMVLEVAIPTLCLVYSRMHGRPELNEVMKKSLPRFNQILLAICERDRELLPVALAGLTSNIELFPTMSRHIADQVLKVCITCMDLSLAQDSPGLCTVGKCLVALSRTGGKNAIATKWQEPLVRLIGSIHEALNILFDTVDEEDARQQYTPGFTFSPMTPDYVEAFPKLVRRIQAISGVISVYLGTKVNVPVSVPVSSLMQLVCRIYNVYPGCLMREFKNRAEYLCLMNCLASLHLCANKILSSLIYCAGPALLPHAKFLGTMMLRLASSENDRRRALKVSVYNLISLCLQTFGFAFAQVVCKPIVALVLKDLQERKPAAIPLQRGKAGTKRRHDDTQQQQQQSKSEQDIPCDVQLAAAQVLEDILMTFGNSLETKVRTNIDTLVVSRILQMEGSDQSACLVKHALYRCLLASVIRPCPTVASILPFAIRIFGAGVNDETHQLRSICQQGAAICDLITHSRLPPIQRQTAPILQAVGPQESMSVAVERHPSPEPEPVVQQPNPVIEQPKPEPRSEMAQDTFSVTTEEKTTTTTTETRAIVEQQQQPSSSADDKELKDIETTTQKEQESFMQTSFTDTTQKVPVPSSHAPTNDDDELLEIPEIDMAGPDEEDDEED